MLSAGVVKPLQTEALVGALRVGGVVSPPNVPPGEVPIPKAELLGVAPPNREGDAGAAEA